MMEWLQDVWQGVVGFFVAIDWSFWGVWSLTVSLLVLGFLGAVLPFLPGPFLIFVAGIVHTVLRPESAMSWTGIGVMGVLLAVAYAIDFFSGMLGARWFGASRWGVAGVFVAVPWALTALKVAAVGYLLWLAWKIARSGAPGEGKAGGRPMTYCVPSSIVP